jgi:acyl-CoA reductase-like NAD-dependent aldehyde dehydrogenase
MRRCPSGDGDLAIPTDLQRRLATVRATSDYDEFVRRVATTAAAARRTRNGTDTQIGPLVSKRQVEASPVT